MNIAQLQGDKSVSALASRLLAEQPASSTSSTGITSQKDMEAALLRLNPHLSQIGSLDRGTPVIVPDNFGLADGQSVAAMRGLAGQLVHQAESALTNLRATLQEHTVQAAAQTDQVQQFLKSDQAKEMVTSSPDLKGVFSSASSALKTFSKEQASTIATQDKALGKVALDLANFRKL